MQQQGRKSGCRNASKRATRQHRGPFLHVIIYPPNPRPERRPARQIAPLRPPFVMRPTQGSATTECSSFWRTRDETPWTQPAARNVHA